MNTESRREHWQNVYTTNPSTAVSWYQDQATTSLELVKPFLVDRHQAVLDIGGGASTLVDGLLTENCTDVSVLDISSAALQVAQARLGADESRVHWLVADLLTWVPQRQYSIWHDRAVLHFLTTHDDQSRYAALIADALAPGGHAVIGTFAPDGPTACSGLAVQQFDSNAVADLLGPNFEVIASRSEGHLTPSRVTQAFEWTVLRRSNAA